MTGMIKSRWTADSRLFVITLRNRGVIQGNTVIEFTHEVPDNQKATVMESIDDLCVPFALYLSFQNRGVTGLSSYLGTPDKSRDAGAAQLTQRQIQILRGMVEDKTNQ